MYPFFDLVIEPTLRAGGVRTIVEIGALRGETTARLLGSLGDDAELHVIDPLPAFDPSDHEKQFPGRYVFHRDLSHNVLPDLAGMDAALIDGDHNWFTVYHELHMLSDAARKDGKPLPLMILHDVGWPYGRRDLYYEPDRIPAEHRQPYERRGILPGRSDLVASGGMNETLCNAVHEGGTRNGVMTAVDDFVGEYDRPLRCVYLPVYFGLAIVVEQAVVDAHPELRDRLDWLDSVEGMRKMAELAEQVRIDAAVEQQVVLVTASERATSSARRYLDLVKMAAGNELGLDVVRVDERFAAIEGCLDVVRTESIPGDVVVCGRDTSVDALGVRGFLEAHDLRFQRVFFAVETSADLAELRRALHRFGLLDSRVRFLQGPFRSTLPTAGLDKASLLCIGAIPPDAVADVLDSSYDRLAVGGFVLIDRYGDPGMASAVDQWRDGAGVDDRLEPVGADSVRWRKLTQRGAGRDQTLTAPRPPIPLLSPLWMGLRDLTVAVVVDDANRARRLGTLGALSRDQQAGMDDVDFEVLAVDASMPVDSQLSAADLAPVGDVFRLADARVASTTPGRLNEAMRSGRGREFLVITDSTRVIDPGLVGRGMAAQRDHAPAVTVVEHESGVTGVFVSRALLEQVGCLDERLEGAGAAGFDREFVERMTASPGLNIVTLGENGSVEVRDA